MENFNTNYLIFDNIQNNHALVRIEIHSAVVWTITCHRLCLCVHGGAEIIPTTAAIDEFKDRNLLRKFCLSFVSEKFPQLLG